jgi:DNA gyrase subunit A
VQGRGAGGVAGIKLRAGASVVAAHPVIGDGVLLTVTNQSTAKATALEELPTKGRAGGGVRVTKLDDATRIELAYVGPIEGLMAAMGSDDDQRKLDPTPVAVDIAVTKRDLISTPTDRQILALGVSRWG